MRLAIAERHRSNVGHRKMRSTIETMKEAGRGGWSRWHTTANSALPRDDKGSWEVWSDGRKDVSGG
jgi:hypothetical protein